MLRQLNHGTSPLCQRHERHGRSYLQVQHRPGGRAGRLRASEQAAHSFWSWRVNKRSPRPRRAPGIASLEHPVYSLLAPSRAMPSSQGSRRAPEVFGARGRKQKGKKLTVGRIYFKDLQRALFHMPCSFPHSSGPSPYCQVT